MSRFPMPIPNSWYHVVWSHELPKGGVKRLRYFGRELVAFRGQDGVARVLDAYCPHLGAHLGVGGKVVENTLACPFHGWRFDGQGACVDAPYAKRTPKTEVGCWPVVEKYGHVFVHYHAEREAPRQELPELPEYGAKDWTGYTRARWVLGSHPQEMAENSVDTAHFLYVHGTLGVPGCTLEERPDHLHITQRARVKRFGRELDTTVNIRLFMPGLSFVRFTEQTEILLVATTTPIDEEHVEQRFSFTANKRAGPLTRSLVTYFTIKEIGRQYEQDKPIWENKIHLPKPILCDGDGPIWALRKWYRRFYSTAPSAEVQRSERAVG